MTAGILKGITIVLRPTAVLTAVPGLLLSPRKTAVTSLTTAMISVFVVFQFGPPSVWSDFLRLPAQWEQALLTTTETDATTPESSADSVVLNSSSEIRPEVQAERQPDGETISLPNQPASLQHVQVIDGYRMAILPGPAASLTYLSLSQSLRQSLQVSPRSEVVAISGKILCIILLTLIGGLSVRQQLKIRSERSVIEPDLLHGGKIPAATASLSDMLQRHFLSGICLMLTADYFFPIRVEYADIPFLIPAAILMPKFLLPRNRILAMATADAFLSHRLLLLGLPDHLASMTAMLRTFMAMYVLIRLTLFETPGQNS